MTGVIGHVVNPTVDDAVELAQASEAAGASWVGLADAFWWRDVWMLLSALARETESIEIGPAMTNPYLRHPFHTASALATLHEAAPGRVFCGVAAGGSEVSGAAGIPRLDAAERAAGLVDLLRRVASGGALDEASNRGLDLVLPPTPILMAGRGDAMLAAAGAVADRVLLWAMPRSDLDRSVALINASAAANDRSPRLIWAPLARHEDVPSGSLAHIVVYASLNSAPAVREAWGLHSSEVAAIRARLVAGELDEAIAMLPEAAYDDLLVDPSDSPVIQDTAKRLGVTEIAVPGFAVDTLPGHLDWASTLEAGL